MAKKIGLEIGTCKTKIIVGEDKKTGFKLAGYEIIDTVEGVFSVDNEIDILKMEFPIKEALDRLKVKSANLYVSINNEKVIIRTRELPRVSKKEMKDVVRFEAENFLPYDINEFYIDYKVLSEIEEEEFNKEDFSKDDEKETLFNVMIIAAPKEIVDQYIELASKLKLKLKLTTVYTEAVNRFVTAHLLKEEKNTLFVDIGDTYTNMIMYEGVQYFANIKTDIGVRGIKNRLSDNHGYAMDEVETNLFSKGEVDREQKITEPKDRLHIIKANVVREGVDQESNKLHLLQKKLEKIKKLKSSMDAPENEFELKRNSEFDALIKEINRMVEFFKSRKYGTFVDYIYLFGGGAYMNDFLAVLVEELGISSSLLPEELLPIPFSNEHFELMIPSIGACIGGKS